MAGDPTSRLSGAMIDTLADSRTNVIAAVNAVVAESDRNPYIEAYLWQFVVAYLYNRTGRYRLGLMSGDNQEYICSRANLMVTQVLEPEYQTFRDGGGIGDGEPSMRSRPEPISVHTPDVHPKEAAMMKDVTPISNWLDSIEEAIRDIRNAPIEELPVGGPLHRALEEIDVQVWRVRDELLGEDEDADTSDDG